MYIIDGKFCGFYFSHIHAEGAQDAQKSVSTMHAKDSAWWLIGFNKKKFACFFFAFTFYREEVSGT